MAPPRSKATNNPTLQPENAPPVADASSARPRVMVHIVAYNAASTLSKVLDRIPHELRPHLTEICVFDDASSDDTFLVGQGYKATRDMPMLKVFRNSHNQGYGGNQKLGYQYAIDNGFDFVVLLHGDGQYAPEAMDLLLQPLISGEAEAVFGSRMLEEGAARRGGMPLYKYMGNKILTKAQNALLEMNLSEFHSGYRAYSVEALKKLPINKNSNDFHFDTQIIIQLKAAAMRIKEVAIPTYYGDEICHVNGMKYARDVMKSVMEYRAHRAGLVRRPEYEHAPVPEYTQKHSTYSSHRRLVDAVPAGSKVLDVGCADGHLARALVAKGCEVVGVDVHRSDVAAQACTRYYVADLESDTWEPEERDFDVILYADVLEHLRNTKILDRSSKWLKYGGRIIASTGNIALWFMRLSLLSGRFQYAPRGILDETHVKLYTRETFRVLIENAGLKVMHEDWTVIPLEKLAESLPSLQRATMLLDSVQYQVARRWPGLFAYQVILQAEPT
jgi:glycosyltransferase involved in cell wall biosynthesis